MNLLEKFLGEFPEEERRSSMVPSSLFKDSKKIDFRNWFLNSELDLSKYDTSKVFSMGQMFKNYDFVNLNKFKVKKRRKNV